MRTFDYKKRYERLLQPDLVALLAQIHEYKGEQALFVEAKADHTYSVVRSCENPEYGGFQ